MEHPAEGRVCGQVLIATYNRKLRSVNPECETSLWSKIAGLPEGEISASLRVGFHVADDNVIKQFDVDDLGRLPQRTSYGYVGLAGTGVAGAEPDRTSRCPPSSIS